MENNSIVKLSVIIPMYNCREVIIRCLESIDYPKAEIIVVDDGSSDDSAEVVRTYSSTHSNVRLVQKINGGPSSARNMGLDYANGEYIMFVDADDIVVSGGIERVLELAIRENADVVKYLIQYIPETSSPSINNLSSFKIQNRLIEGKAKALDYYDISDYHVVDALFKREIINTNNIRFNTDLHLHEDDVFMGEVYCCASKVIGTNLPLYIYNVASPQSSTHRVSEDKLQRLLDSANKAIQLRQEIVKRYFPEKDFPLEKYKHMRYAMGCLWTMLQEDFTIQKFETRSKDFQMLGVWPLKYKWIEIARLDGDFRSRIKFIVKTFFCNHPRTYLFIKRIASKIDRFVKNHVL